MPNGSDVLEALKILAGYEKPGALTMVPEHDEIWIGHEIAPKKMSAADVSLMNKLGFEWDDDTPAWHGNVSA